MTAEESTCNGGSKVEVEKKLGFELRSEVHENGVRVGDDKLGESNGVVVVNGGSEGSKESDADLDQKVEPISDNGVFEGSPREDEQNLVNASSLEVGDGQEVEEIKEEDRELSLENGSKQDGGFVSTPNSVNEGSGLTVEPVQAAVTIQEEDEANEENGELSFQNVEVKVGQLKESESLDVLIRENIGSHSALDMGENKNGDDLNDTEGEEHVETHEGECKVDNDVGDAVDDSHEAVAEPREVDLTEYQENGTTAEEVSNEGVSESVDEVEEKSETQTGIVETTKVQLTKNQENGVTVNETIQEAATEFINDVEDRPEAPAAQTDSLVVGCTVDDDEREMPSNSGNGGDLQEEPVASSREDDQEEVLALGSKIEQNQESLLAEDVDDLQVSETAISASHDSVGRKAAAVMENQNSDREEELRSTLPVGKEKEQVVLDPDSVANYELETKLAPATELQLENETCILKDSKQNEPESAAVIELQQAPQASIPENAEQAEAESSVNVIEEQAQTEMESAVDVPEEQKLQSTVVETQPSESSMFSNTSLGLETGGVEPLDTSKPPRRHENGSCIIAEKSSDIVLSDEAAECVNELSELEIAGSSYLCSTAIGVVDSNPSDNLNDIDTESSVKIGVENSSSDNPKVSYGHKTDKDLDVKCTSSDEGIANSNMVVNHFAAVTCEPVTESENLKCVEVECVTKSSEEDQLVDKKEMRVVSEPVTEIETRSLEGIGTEHPVHIENENLEETEAEKVEEVEDENAKEIETRQVEDSTAEHPVHIENENLVDREAEQVEEIEDENAKEIENQQVEGSKAEHQVHIENENLEDREAEQVEKVEDENAKEMEDIKAEQAEEIGTANVEDTEHQRVAEIEVEHQEEMELRPSDEFQAGTGDLNSKISDGEKVDVPVVKRLPCFIIKVPRLNIDDRTRIENVQSEIDEKTKNRDSINALMQKQKVTCIEYQKMHKTAQKEEVAARDSFRSTREKLEPIQSKLSKLKIAHSLDELDNKIRSMEYTMQHETMTIKEEKKYLHELTLVRQQRTQLSSTMGPKGELDEALSKEEQYNVEIKALMKELDSLRNNLLRAETNTKAARKRYNDEQKILNDLRKQFEAANDARQISYEQLRNLKNESFEKNKYFHMYKNDKNAAENLRYSGDAKGLRLHCVNQVEKVMELWNNNEQFRKSYVECNKNSTLRRLRTSDGRSLGPDEEAPLLQNDRLNTPNVPSTMNIAAIPTPTRTPTPTPEAKPAELPEEKVSVPALQPSQKSKPDKTEKATKPVPKIPKETTRSIVVDEEQAELAANNSKPSKEEEEQMRKAEEFAMKEEELRKEKAAAELKEKQRLEQRIKAKEAEERKKRQAEKAQARAEQRAKKEAEYKEKKQAKKDKKKVLADKDATNDEDEISTPSTDNTPSETAQVLDNPVQTPSRRPSRLPAATKQYNKMQPVPLPLRNRAKRKTRTWMWVILSTLVVLILFLAGNYVSFNLSAPHFSS